MFTTPFDYKLALLLSASAYTENFYLNNNVDPIFRFVMYKAAFNITAKNLTPEERPEFYGNFH